MKKLFFTIMCLFQTLIGFSQSDNEIFYDIAANHRTDCNVYLNSAWNLDYNVFQYADFIRQIALVPSDAALRKFVDPVTYGSGELELWELNYDSASRSLYADVYACQQNSDGTYSRTGDVKRQVNQRAAGFNSRLEHIMQNCIILEPYVEGKRFYKTLGNNYVCIDKAGGGYNVSASMQSNLDMPVASSSDNTLGNGLAIYLDSPPLTGMNNVARTLAQHEEFSEFLYIMNMSGLLGTSTSDRLSPADREYGNLVFSKKTEGTQWKVFPLLQSFHYTLYVPTNDAMQEAYRAGLPSKEDLLVAEQYDSEHENEGAPTADQLRAVMKDFVLYHLQEQSLFLDKGFKSGYYTSLVSKYFKEYDDSYEETTLPGSPYRMRIYVDNKSLTITDARGNKIHVVTQPGLYNIMANEYWIGSDMIKHESFVAVHAIDKPLRFSSRQFTDDRTGDDEVVMESDVNEDEKVDISDIVAVINTMARTSSLNKADVNGDGTVDISDVVTVINSMASK